MKILLPLLLISTLLVACKKDNDSSNPTTDYFLRFKANGQNVIYDGLFTGQTGQVSTEKLRFSTYTQLVIHGVGDGFNDVLMLFGVDSVKSGQTYIFDELGDGSFKLKINGKDYTTLPSTTVNSQYIVTVVVEKHSEGLIRGNFWGQVAAQKIDGSFEVVTLTDGSFNSKVIYH